MMEWLALEFGEDGLLVRGTLAPEMRFSSGHCRDFCREYSLITSNFE